MARLQQDGGASKREPFAVGAYITGALEDVQAASLRPTYQS
jgi:hypothetical protein